MTRFPANAHVTLMSSLPHLGDLFRVTQTPLSRLRLDARLRLLSDPELELLRQIEQVLQWSHQPLGRDDPAAVALAEQLLRRLERGILYDLVLERLEYRTLVAALRRRHRGETVSPSHRWGVGRWQAHLSRHWLVDDFHLAAVFPWISKAHGLLEQGQPEALERLLLSTAWDHHTKLAEGHYFDFPAVVIYVLKWNIMDRWVSRSSERAVQRFRQLGVESLSPVRAALDALSEQAAAKGSTP
jgi:hypothetical protein